MAGNFNSDDKELFLRIAREDEDAFNEAFYRYHRYFYAAAIKMTHSQAIAEELVQDVFTTLWIKRDDLQHMEKPYSYLLTTLYHGIYAHLKKQATEKLRMEEARRDIADQETPTEALVLAKEQRLLINEALSRLPEQQRKVYQLIKQEGLSREEAARILGLSPHTVKNHLSEASRNILSSLKKMLIVLILIVISGK